MMHSSVPFYSFRTCLYVSWNALFTLTVYRPDAGNIRGSIGADINQNNVAM